MAIDFGTSRPGVSFAFQDYNLGRSGKSGVTLQATATVAQIQAQALALEAIYAQLSDAFIVAGSVSLRGIQTDPLLAGQPPATSQLGRKGVFVFETDEGTTATYEIPSIDRTLVLPGSKSINIDAPAVAAYIAFMLGGLAGLGGQPVTEAGIGLRRLRAAYERGDDEGRDRR